MPTIAKINLMNASVRYYNLNDRFGDGKRTITLTLPKEVADEMTADQWPVIPKERRDEPGKEDYVLNCHIDLESNFPHSVINFVCVDGTSTPIEDGTVLAGLSENMRIVNADVQLRLNQTNRGGRSITTAYVTRADLRTRPKPKVYNAALNGNE